MILWRGCEPAAEAKKGVSASKEIPFVCPGHHHELEAPIGSIIIIIYMI